MKNNNTNNNNKTTTTTTTKQTNSHIKLIQHTNLKPLRETGSLYKPEIYLYYDVQWHTFWSSFVFCEHVTREPASAVCDDKMGDLVYSAGPHRNLH